MAEVNEMGKLPEGWKRVRLEEVAENTKFAIVDGPFGTQLHSDEYIEDGKIPVIRVTNLTFEGKFVRDNLVFIKKRKADVLKRSKVVPGDIIIAKTGATIGKSGIFPQNFSEGIIASSCLKLSVDKLEAPAKFILYFIVSHRGQKAILDNALGTTRTTINITPFSKISLFLPPLPEQRKIAETLETVHNAIEKTDKIIEKYKRIKQGLMQDLLTRGIDENGQIRSEETHKFKDSPLGRIPEEWEVVELWEVISLEYGKGLPERERNLGQYPVYGSNGIVGYHNNFLVKGPGIIVGRKGTMGEVSWSDSDFWPIDTTYFIKTKKSDISLRWLFLELVNLNLKKLVLSDVVPGLNRNDAYSLQFPQPPLPEQHHITSILSQIDETIEKEQKYKEKLERIKQGLMQDLLTGKVRVNHLIEEGVENVPQT